jgi:hypothetical protein
MDNATFRNAVIRLQNWLDYNNKKMFPRPPFTSREEVLGRYQPIFAREHLPELTVSEFRSFLEHKNNKNWRGLHRSAGQVTSDMKMLRKRLDLLLYGEGSIAPRFTKAIGAIRGMGPAIASALLLVMYPDRYGVWNGTSQKGMEYLDLWPDFGRGASKGKKYLTVNKRLLSLACEMEIDLWTLDALWWDAAQEAKKCS